MKSTVDLHRMLGLILLASVATLPACVQPRVQQPEGSEGATAERVSLLTNQVASLQRYTSQMEELYAAQEAEILKLRQQVASLSPSQSD